MASRRIQNVSSLMRRVEDVSNEPLLPLSPILGYEKLVVASLKDAVKLLVNLVPDVERMVYTAQLGCDNPMDNLRRDQSAAIWLYTLQWGTSETSLYYKLNDTLRNADRGKLIPWFAYLNLLIYSLSWLPSEKRTVYRGVKKDLYEDYHAKKTIVWWAFSSCTAERSILDTGPFLGPTGPRTLFEIECYSGKSIDNHSFHLKEKEVLLLPARLFQVISCQKSTDGLVTIHLKEIEPDYPLIEPVSMSSYVDIHIIHPHSG